MFAGEDFVVWALRQRCVGLSTRFQNSLHALASEFITLQTTNSADVQSQCLQMQCNVRFLLRAS